MAPKKGAKSRVAAVKKKLAPKKCAKSPAAALQKKPEIVLNSLLNKHREQWVGGTRALKHELTTFVTWPQNMRKRSTPRQPRKVFTFLNQASEAFNNNLGLVRRCGGSVPQRKAEEGAPANFVTLSKITHCLYEELLEEILLRLPVRSLIRLRCVCKSWRDLIDDEKFIYLHQKNNKPSYLLMGNCHMFSRDYSISSFLPSHGNDPLQKVAVLKPRPCITSWRYKMTAGACNGIVCLYECVTEDILLWNPATKDINFIPQSTVPRPPKLGMRVVGFGFDPQRNDYKILQMVHFGNSFVVQLELYSLRANSWKKIDSDHDIELRDNHIAHGVCGLPFTENRVICWLINTHPKQPEIMCFDMSSETLETIHVPVPLDIQHPRCYNLFPLRSSIGLGIGYYGQQPEHNASSIYVLNDFYATQRSWTRLFLVKHQTPLTPIASWDNLILLQEPQWMTNFLLLDSNTYHDNPNLVRLGIICPSIHAIFCAYRESLVRVSKTEEK